MLLHISQNGTVLSAQDVDKYIVADMDSLFTKKGDKYLLNDVVMPNNPVISIVGFKLDFIFMPASYCGNIYYLIKDDGIILSDSFEYMTTISKTFDYSQQIAGNDHLDTGETWDKNVKRLFPYSIYRMVSDELIRDEIEIPKLSEIDLYLAFKERINKVIDSRIKKNNVLLLSGGADSRLLLLLLKSKGVNFSAVTCSNTFAQISYDALIAEKLCKALDVPINIVTASLSDYSLINYNQIIHTMPENVHLMIPFLKMAEVIANLKLNKNDTAVFTGQNADSLYELGPSERLSLSVSGMANLFKRYCLTESYMKGFKDVIGYNSISGIVNRLISLLCLAYYNEVKTEKNNLPLLAECLINNFRDSNDYTVFSSINHDKRQQIKYEALLPETVIDTIFRNKIYDFVNSSDSQVIRSCFKLFNIDDVFFPYSEHPMIVLFYSRKHNIRDIFSPKKFIYMYIKELSCECDIRLNKFNIKCFDNTPKPLDSLECCAQIILKNSELGTLSLSLPENMTPQSSREKLRLCLANYWKRQVFDSFYANIH